MIWLEPLVGVEPTTPALQVRCSAGLSYSGIPAFKYTW